MEKHANRKVRALLDQLSRAASKAKPKKLRTNVFSRIYSSPATHGAVGTATGAFKGLQLGVLGGGATAGLTAGLAGAVGGAIGLAGSKVYNITKNRAMRGRMNKALRRGLDPAHYLTGSERKLFDAVMKNTKSTKRDKLIRMLASGGGGAGIGAAAGHYAGSKDKAAAVEHYFFDELEKASQTLPTSVEPTKRRGGPTTRVVPTNKRGGSLGLGNIKGSSNAASAERSDRVHEMVGRLRRTEGKMGRSWIRDLGTMGKILGVDK